MKESSNVAVLIEKEKQIQPFSKEKLEEILNTKNYKPEDLINFLKIKYKDIYESDAGVWEGYSIEEHTLMAMNQFEKYYSDKELPIGIERNFFRFMLSIHDIGKPEAIKTGDIKKQHEFTIKEAQVGKLSGLWSHYSKDNKLFKSLVGQDYLGTYIKGGDIDSTFVKILEASRKTDLSPSDFLKALEIYYKVDAGSYTEDAGGKKSLDRLFNFDQEKKELSFSKEVEDKFSLLKNKIMEHENQENKLKTDTLDKKDQKELRDFSKKYALSFRKETAQKINNLRFAYENKLVEKPKEIEKYQEDISVKKDEKEKKEQELLLIQKDLEEKERELESLQQSMNEWKNEFWVKIRSFLSKKSVEEELKLYTSSIETIKNYISNKEVEGQTQEEILNRLNKEIEEKYRLIEETESLLSSEEELEEIKNASSNFYSKIKQEKINLDLDSKFRDITTISLKNEALFCHALPIEREYDNSFSQNNALVNTRKIEAEEKIKMIIGIEPTISVSSINNTSQKLVRKFGVILKGGKILSAYAGDAGTLIEENINNRKSKYDSDLKHSNLQSGIEEKINKALLHINTRTEDNNGSISSMDQGWNEIIVENPQLAGIYCQDVEILKKNIADIYGMSKNLSLPVYLIEGTKISEMIFPENSELSYQKIIKEDLIKFKQVSLKEVLENKVMFSKNQKADIAESVIDRETFEVKKENIYKFNSYNIGRAQFNFMKRIDAGEMVEVRRIDDVHENNENFFAIVGGGIKIEKLEYDEWQWEHHGKESWGEYGYHGYARKSKEDGKVRLGGMASGIPGWEFYGEIDKENGISSYLDLAESNLNERMNQMRDLKLKRENTKNLDLVKKSYIFNLYGFAEECKKIGDLLNYERAIKIIEKFGDLKSCQNFVEKRQGKDGKFQTLEEDIPLEIREKIKDLKK